MASPTLDDFMSGVVTSDTKKRIETGEALSVYLQDNDCSLYCEETDKFMEGLAGWVSSSNFKVSLLGLQVLSMLVDRMGAHFKPHVTTVLSNVVDRLGDGKDQVREGARELIIKMMSKAAPRQFVLERLQSAFTHKLWKVKEELLICIQRCLDEFGAKNMGVSKIVPQIVKLLDDQSIPVRDQAVTTLVEMYRHVGEKLRNDLSRREINPNRMAQILMKMDELQAAGLVMDNDDTDSVQSAAVQQQFTKPAAKRSTSSTRISSASSSNSTAVGGRGNKAAAGAGAVDEESFTRSFEDVPKIHIFTVKDLTDYVTKIKDTLSDTNADWEKRVEALKLIRALVIQEGTQFSEFSPLLRTLENCVKLSVTDLRSQVVREACITTSFLSERLGKEFDRFAEALVPALIQLVPNSAKVMATSGVVALRFIVQYTHTPRIIPLITTNLTSKSSVIRKQCCELLDLMLRTWNTSVLERQASVLQDALKKGLTDADSEARVHSRKAYWAFEEHFRDLAAQLFNSLDASQQKLLQGAQGAGSSSSSSSSLNTAGRQIQPPKSRARSISTDRTVSSGYGRSAAPSGNSWGQASAKAGRVPCSLPYDDGMYGDDLDARTPALPKQVPGSSKASRVNSGAAGNYASLRPSKSSTDLSRVNSALNYVRAVPLQRNMSLRYSRKTAPHDYAAILPPRQRKVSGGGVGVGQAGGVLSPEKQQHKARAKMSQSQPGSRSNSPNSRLSYLTHQGAGGSDHSSVYTASRVRSTASSRDSSPNRDRKSMGRAGRVSIGPGGRRSQGVTGGRASSVSHQPATEDIEAVATALRNRGGRGDVEGMGDDASETSSVCSDGSSYRSAAAGSDNISEIISFMSSGAWSERKEGLLSLQNYLQNKSLTRAELKKVTDTLSRMFNDPHPKVYSVFMDSLVELIAVHSADLHEWLPICLTRLINKLGSDMYGSVQARMVSALDAIRESFPYGNQFAIVCKYLTEQTQNPNPKVKMGLLNYLHGLIRSMSSTDLQNNADTRLAISRFITWTTEPKSVDIRKAAQAVLLDLYNLNSTEFSFSIQHLPKTFQENIVKILQTHEPLSPHNAAASGRSPSQTRGTSLPRSNETPTQQRMNRSGPGALGSEFSSDTENMNPEDIYQSIKQATAEIQNLSLGGRGVSPHNRSGGSHLPRPYTSTPADKYNPNQYKDQANMRLKSNGAPHGDVNMDVGFHDDIFDEEFPENAAEFLIEDIIADLSKLNENDQGRLIAMKHIAHFTRDADSEFWSNNFRHILLVLIENLNDNNENIRTRALEVLTEIVRSEADRFRDYTELTIIKILNAQLDESKDVARAAEDCCDVVAALISPEQCLRTLSQFTQSSEYPLNLAAIKMQIKVVESVQDLELMRSMLPVMIPGLLKGYDDAESPVRKASVFCLVAVYLIIGEELRASLTGLSGHKVKLLNLYIKRALAHRNDSTSTPNSTSPTSVADLV